MHTQRLVSFLRLISFVIAFCYLNNVQAAESKTGDSSTENVYLKTRAPESLSRICGIYLWPGALIAGTELHIFPDGAAMVAEFSDISLPRVIAIGSWEYEADILKITWSRLLRREIFKSSMLPKRQGDTHEYIMYTGVSSDRKTIDYFLVPSDAQSVERSNMLSQFQRYLDWQKIKSTYLSQTEESEKATK